MNTLFINDIAVKSHPFRVIVIEIETIFKNPIIHHMRLFTGSKASFFSGCNLIPFAK